ncbi:MAG: TPM domain-containing protein, partial [Coriobacteriia bacterium]
MRQRQRFWCTIAVLLLVWLATAAVALAAPPLKLDAGLLTDDARVLGDSADSVEQALEQLESDHGVQLFVVFVETFDSYSAQDWANETAEINGLGLNDVLLAVAVVDREYAWSVAGNFPLSDSALDEVAADDIEPALSDDDWAGAAIAAAEGYADALDAQAADDGVVTTTPDGDSGGGSLWCCLLPGVLAAGLAAAAAFFFKRKKGGKGARAGGAQGDPSTKELETTAGKLLVDVDEALRASEQELGFAEAEFGGAAIKEYRAAFEESKKEVTEAFRIQQQVFDSEPEDEATRRGMLQKIIALAGAADAQLDAKADDFSQLRDLAGRADEVIAAVGDRLAKVEAGLREAKDKLAQLKTRYLESALGDVADDDTEAAALVDAARKAAGEGTDASAKGDRNAAALAA